VRLHDRLRHQIYTTYSSTTSHDISTKQSFTPTKLYIKICKICQSVISQVSLVLQHWSSMTFHDQILHKYIIYRHSISDSQRQSATVEDCPQQSKVRNSQRLSITKKSAALASHCQLSVVVGRSVMQCMVNHSFYIIVNNLCKQLQHFHNFTIIFNEFP